MKPLQLKQNDTQNNNRLSDKKVLISGFLFGVVIAPILATLGMMSAHLEFLKPLFIGPMLLMGSFIPDRQTAPDTFEAPIYKWILSLGFNGICFSILGVLILSLIKLNKSKKKE